ncbi:YibE/F family protein [Pelotomaculum sp. FP]|uniref:YibE/F family protein n=1 Tax=Pelotomaculum sp. FP TaxID=261474 RepID=UPI001FAA8018|nr:YibE/F family protein [Pelotomaculum sp. FP]
MVIKAYFYFVGGCYISLKKRCFMKSKFIFFLFMGAVLFSFVIITPARCQESEEGQSWNKEQVVRAKILNVEDKLNSQEVMGAPEKGKEQSITVRVLGGQYNGQVLQVPHTISNHPGYDINVQPGDEVILYIEPDGNSIKNAYITDYARDKKLLYITLLFVFTLLLLGGKKGFKSTISLVITIGAIFLVLLPLILQGYDPVLMTIIISAVVAAVTLAIVGGITIKALSALIGTTGGVLTAGLLALTVGTAAQLTGFSDEDMHMLLYIPHSIDFDCRGLLFAGMIIGALGAVMDVGMSIASAIEEIMRANPAIGTGQLIRAGMNVGRDIMGTMANTLILAYTGGAIPLMLVFMAYDTPFLKIINLDLIATEVVRALTGSIGLIMAIPITSFTSGILFGLIKRNVNPIT